MIIHKKIQREKIPVELLKHRPQREEQTSGPHECVCGNVRLYKYRVLLNHVTYYLYFHLKFLN